MVSYIIIILNIPIGITVLGTVYHIIPTTLFFFTIQYTTAYYYIIFMYILLLFIIIPNI